MRFITIAGIGTIVGLLLFKESIFCILPGGLTGTDFAGSIGCAFGSPFTFFYFIALLGVASYLQLSKNVKYQASGERKRTLIFLLIVILISIFFIIHYYTH